MIDPSSKMSLKMSCLRACDNNVTKARELYEFLAQDIAEIPDIEPIKPTGFESVKRGASEVLEWISSHKEDVAQGVSFIKSLQIGKTGAMAPAPNIPPIPKI